MNNSKSVHFNRGLEREDRMEGSSGAYWDVKVSKIGNYALSWSGLVCKMLRRKKHGSSIINIHSWGVTTLNFRVDTQISERQCNAVLISSYPCNAMLM